MGSHPFTSQPNLLPTHSDTRSFTHSLSHSSSSLGPSLHPPTHPLHSRQPYPPHLTLCTSFHITPAHSSHLLVRIIEGGEEMRHWLEAQSARSCRPEEKRLCIHLAGPIKRFTLRAHANTETKLA